MRSVASFTAVSAALLCALLITPSCLADETESVTVSDSYQMIVWPDIPIAAWVDVTVTGPPRLAGGENWTYDISFTLRYEEPIVNLQLLSASWSLGWHEPDESDPEKSYFKADSGILTLSGVSSGPVRTAIISVSPERWPHWDSAGDAHFWFSLGWQAMIDMDGYLQPLSEHSDVYGVDSDALGPFKVDKAPEKNGWGGFLIPTLAVVAVVVIVAVVFFWRRKGPGKP